MKASLGPVVDCDFHHTRIPVSDVLAAVEFYTKKLGFELRFTGRDPVAIAGVNLGQAQIFLQEGTPNPVGCSMYFVVGDADELWEFQRSKGVEIIAEPEDRPYGLRDFEVRDLHGYQLGFGHYIYTVGEPIPVSDSLRVMRGGPVRVVGTRGRQRHRPKLLRGAVDAARGVGSGGGTGPFVGWTCTDRVGRRGLSRSQVEGPHARGLDRVECYASGKHLETREVRDGRTRSQ